MASNGMIYRYKHFVSLDLLWQNIPLHKHIQHTHTLNHTYTLEYAIALTGTKRLSSKKYL